MKSYFKNIFLTIISVFILSCSSSKNINLATNGEDVYISNGVEQYFMAQLPHWSNFSNTGRCYRSTPIRYVDYSKVSKSYNLNYSNFVHLQHMINRKIYAYKSSIGHDQRSPKDASFIFQNTYQKVIGGSTDFITPKYKKISLIWIDRLIGKDILKLKKALNHKTVQAGHPVIVSTCLNSYEMERMIQSHKLESFGAKFISSEMFSIFDIAKLKQPYFSFNFMNFFKNKELEMYIFNNQKMPLVDERIKQINLF